jgi:3-deoxy-D-manno-octulosonate 8-phosphate phosphatase (KDO 8-P phosphatase)
MQEIYDRARKVRLAIFDVDGVLTDGRLYYGAAGEEMKVFNVRDGHGIRMLGESGVRVALLTSRSSEAVALRARNLGIELVFQGVSDKLSAFEKLLAQLQLGPAATAYMGDDLIDAPVLTRCGFAISVPEAPAAVRGVAHYVTQAGGGLGAAREACELIMQAQGTFDARLAAYLR